MEYTAVNKPMSILVREKAVDTYINSTSPVKYVHGYVVVTGSGSFAVQMVEGTGRVFINGHEHKPIDDND